MKGQADKRKSDNPPAGKQYEKPVLKKYKALTKRIVTGRTMGE